MSASLRYLRLVWPREVTAVQVEASMRLLAAVGGTPLLLEALGQRGRVEHRLGVLEGRASALTTQLRSAVSGLGIEGVAADHAALPEFQRAVSLRLSTRRRPLRIERAEATARGVLTALAYVGSGETLLLQWLLKDPLLPSVVPNRIDSLESESLWRALLSAPFGVPGPADADTRNALRDKRREPGWRVVGRIAVQAASRSRQEQLIRHVLQALRTAEAPGVHLTARSLRPSSVNSTAGRAGLVINCGEMGALASWPIGSSAELPVVRLGSRRIPPASAVPRAGRIIGLSTWPGRERPLALSPDDSLRHLHVLGPTGTGKSTVLLGLITQDMAAGRGVVVIEPKGDLVADVLARVPKHRSDDVVVLDPTDQERPIGLNPLSAVGQSPELAADQLLATFHGLYAANWGPRTSDILHASLLTLARSPGMSLPALPLLLGNPAFRRRLVGRLNDPLGLQQFWAQYEAWSEAERTTATAPVMNKLRPFLLRPGLRRIIGQSQQSFDLRQVFSERKIVLVNLAKGALGSEAAGLLGALVVASLWRAAMGRGAVPPEQRHPVFVYIDEFQDYLHLPTDLGEALAQARSLGIGLTLAHQHLSQLSPSLRAGVLANARSRLCFQLGSDDAKTMAATSPLLGADDFSSLDNFHFYSQLVAGGAVQAWCSGRSQPPGRTTSDPAALRAASRQRYGVDREEIDRGLEALLDVRPASRQSGSSHDDLAPRRRGGTS